MKRLERSGLYRNKAMGFLTDIADEVTSWASDTDTDVFGDPPPADAADRRNGR